MSKFKVGDKVRIIKASGGDPVGTETEIAGEVGITAREEEAEYKVKAIEEPDYGTWYALEHELELIEEKVEFKPGDHVHVESWLGSLDTVVIEPPSPDSSYTWVASERYPNGAAQDARWLTKLTKFEIGDKVIVPDDDNNLRKVVDIRIGKGAIEYATEDLVDYPGLVYGWRPAKDLLPYVEPDFEPGDRVIVNNSQGWAGHEYGELATVSDEISEKPEYVRVVFDKQDRGEGRQWAWYILKSELVRFEEVAPEPELSILEKAIAPLESLRADLIKTLGAAPVDSLQTIQARLSGVNLAIDALKKAL